MPDSHLNRAFFVIAIRYEGMDGVKTTSPAGGSKKL